MLVLRRTIHDTIFIDGDICITVLAIEGPRVKIGIQAPPETVIVRGELVGETPAFPLPDLRAGKEQTDG